MFGNTKEFVPYLPKIEVTENVLELFEKYVLN